MEAQKLKKDLLLKIDEDTDAFNGIMNAFRMSKKTIEMFPEEASYLDTYAWILYKMKKYEQAKSWMQKAIDISESETFYSHMADILIELGEKEESEFYLEKAKQFR